MLAAPRKALTAAAVVVGMSQPAATMALARAERIVGGRLFHRGPAGAVTTGLGELVGATPSPCWRRCGAFRGSRRPGPRPAPASSGSVRLRAC
ncbi:helix-turn-helix domain-containing protein [Pilimelia anulata]|uniref:helix-turn-helix domain-containing protein n=1 Tax=Pilimelia anulata TaxID=53371 RepID=UPI00166CADB9